MGLARVTCVMPIRAVALAVLLCVAPPAVPAAAEQTDGQKLFRKRLLNDRGVKPEVKQVLRSGGFVDRDIRFGDLTGDGKSDALVLVNEGGSAGRIALYVYSSHRTNDDGGGGDELRIRFKRQNLYRASAKLKQASALRRNGDRFESHVGWAANFPDGGPGRYAVVWRLGADQLGPTLGFRRE